MAGPVPSSPAIPVIRDETQLDAYLAAFADGSLARFTESMLMDRPSWLEVAGSGGEDAWAHAEKLGLPLVDATRVAVVPDVVALFPRYAAQRLKATALRDVHGCLAVAIDAETDATLVSMLGFVSSRAVVPMVATRPARKAEADALDALTEDEQIARQMGLTLGRRGAERSARQRDLETRWLMIKTMRGTLTKAVQLRASDVHVRPGARHFEVLFRIDGNMVHQRDIAPEVAALVVNRIKVFGDMDIAERRRPQDGRGSFKLESGRRVDLRLSIVPTILGESVVVRLLDTEESFKTLDQIQLTPADRATLDDQMSRTSGFFLAVGPTGCGKSTTLYAMLQALRQQPINIMTVEDPVEYTLSGVRQTEARPGIGFGFANALRSFLRHDPDVVMVGEIRDGETARMAVESALTGHLVLSTLHTNTAATTVTRLLDLGVEAYLLRASLTGVLAQRLVRLTCTECRTQEAPAAHLRAALGVAPDEVFTIGRGCPRCHGTGVHRRRAVYELMRVSPAIRDLIERGASADQIHQVAIAEGMVPITEAALRLTRDGQISLAEAYRVRLD